MSKAREQERRILAAISDLDVKDEVAFRRWYKYLASHLTLPFDVTGIEDFQWEEFFVLGPANKAVYKRLQRKRPSYRDVFELTSIIAASDYSESEWCMFPDELKAHVRRKSDGKRFVLGLSELKGCMAAQLSLTLAGASHGSTCECEA